MKGGAGNCYSNYPRYVSKTDQRIRILMNLNYVQGLRHIHSLGILHLDLKPANILVTGIGSLQISDFGLSTFENRKSATCRTPTIGSPREGDREYLSPETLDGQFGRATDVFRYVRLRRARVSRWPKDSSEWLLVWGLHFLKPVSISHYLPVCHIHHYRSAV